MTKYDVTIQWTDEAREPGYRETVQKYVVSGETIEDAFGAASQLRPLVSRVQIHGVHGTAIAFDGASWSRRYSTGR